MKSFVVMFLSDRRCPYLLLLHELLTPTPTQQSLDGIQKVQLTVTDQQETADNRFQPEKEKSLMF